MREKTGKKIMGRKEQMQEKAQKHTEIMDRLYSKEIKISNELIIPPAKYPKIQRYQVW